jgi:hypothetical protein
MYETHIILSTANHTNTNSHFSVVVTNIINCQLIYYLGSNVHERIMAPGKKRPAAVKTPAGNPHFKRLKAKVGKRAPKSANLTDTSFRSARVSVRTQTVDSSSQSASVSALGVLQSSRGLSLSELSTQLHHPAAAVRLSASKGIDDLVSHATSEQIWSHLSSLMPSTAKCCVDEEDEVRERGLFILQGIISKLGAHASDRLRPFSPLLIACMTSALNSLDTTTRRDGAIAIEMLSKTAPSLVAPHVVELLPAFTRLLTEKSLFKIDSRTSGAKKRKRAAPETNFTLAGALFALLDTSSTPSAAIDYNLTNSMNSDMTIEDGGRGRNAVFIQGPHRRDHQLHVIDGVKDMASVLQTKVLAESELGSAGWGKTPIFPPSQALEFMKKIREAFIDATQRGSAGSNAALFLSDADKGILYSIVRSLRIFWESFGAAALTSGGPDGFSAETKQLKHVLLQVAKLLLECFPVAAANADSLTSDEVNAELCAALFCLSATESLLDSERFSWIATVASHVETSLGRLGRREHTGITQVGLYSHILTVFEKLIDQKYQLLQVQRTRVALVKVFCSAFFADSGLSTSLVVSTAGTKAVSISCKMLKSFHYDLTAAGKELGGSVTQIVLSIPCYLACWKGEFPAASHQAIKLLHEVSRRLGCNDDSFAQQIRTRLEAILPNSSTPEAASIIELYETRATQRLFISLLIMLGKPSTEAIGSLGILCSRARLHAVPSIAPDIASFVVQSVHSIRTTLPMQVYLAFILESTGLTAITDAILKRSGAPAFPLSTEAVEQVAKNLLILFSFDVNVREVSRCFIDCGSSKTFGMLQPLLLSWIDVSKVASPMRISCLLRLRAALAFLGLFALDMESMNDANSMQTSSDCNLLTISATIVNASVTLLQYGPNNGDGGSLGKWTSPIRAVLASEHRLLPLFIQEVASATTTMNTSMQGRCLLGCLEIVKSTDLETAVRSISVHLLPHARKIEGQITGPNAAIASRLLGALELVSSAPTRSEV